MKKIVVLVLSCLFISGAFCQTAAKKKIDLTGRPADHFMIQLSSDHWTNMPDSISSHQKGFSRGLNIYVMLDKPFMSSPKFSVGFGLGVSSSNIFFKKMSVDLKAAGAKLPFTAKDSTDHFKKYKVSLSYLEIPLELRFSSDPLHNTKSFKAALGVKVGTMINAHTKGKTLQNKNNATINSYTAKENSKNFFNTTRIAATARIGYGIFSLFGAYQINNVLKDAAGTAMKSYQIGLSISGL